MQEYIINGLLIVVALLAVILQIIGTRPSAGMTKKQKVMLWRILTATVLRVILQVLGAGAFEVFGAVGRWGTPEDMQGTVVWLASKASDYVNGYTVAVDGGWLAR